MTIEENGQIIKCFEEHHHMITYVTINVKKGSDMVWGGKISFADTNASWYQRALTEDSDFASKYEAIICHKV